MSLTFEDRTAQYQSRINDFMTKWCKSLHGQPQETLFSAMEYSLLAGGKRLRPILVFEFCRMCGGNWEKALPFAAAIEMIHTYSLIHDDLPCMDDDDYRRDRLTNHKVYGEAMAVLAGDALLTDAFSMLTTAELPGETIAMAVRTLSECAGSLGMVGGQVLDMQSEERICSEQEVLAIQSRKTGALIRAACVLGTIVGGAAKEQTDHAVVFANKLGLAFQIRDDMLDVIGDAQELGKATGMDENKNTFVCLYGLDACGELVRKYTEEAIRELDSFENKEFMLQLVCQMINRTK